MANEYRDYIENDAGEYGEASSYSSVVQQRLRAAHRQAIEEARPFSDLIYQVRLFERPKYILCDGVLSLLDDGLSQQQRAVIRQCEEWISEIHKRALDSVSVYGCSAMRAMVLVYEPRLTCSVWQDYGGIADEDTGDEILRSNDEMISDLKDGVREGRWVAWRLIRIEREVMGNVD